MYQLENKVDQFSTPSPHAEVSLGKISNSKRPLMCVCALTRVLENLMSRSLRFELV